MRTNLIRMRSIASFYINEIILIAKFVNFNGTLTFLDLSYIRAQLDKPSTAHES